MIKLLVKGEKDKKMIVKENEKLMQAISEENNKFVCVLMMHKWHGGMDINQGGSILCFLFVFSYPPQPQHPLRKTDSVDGCRLVNTLFVRQKAVFQDKINHVYFANDFWKQSNIQICFFSINLTSQAVLFFDVHVLQTTFLSGLHLLREIVHLTQKQSLWRGG